jgi:hypothetical protein
VDQGFTDCGYCDRNDHKDFRRVSVGYQKGDQLEMNTQVLTQILVMAVLLEALVQTVKPIWKPEQASVSFYVSLGIGMVVSVGMNYLAGLDIFSAVGIPLVKAPVVGVVATGLLISRGSNFVHDLIKSILHFKDILADILSNAKV